MGASSLLLHTTGHPPTVAGIRLIIEPLPSGSTPQRCDLWIRGPARARATVFGRYSGEWRNGRRAGFRCQCPSGRGGSSPPSPTTSSWSLLRLRAKPAERPVFVHLWGGRWVRGARAGPGRLSPESGAGVRLASAVARDRLARCRAAILVESSTSDLGATVLPHGRARHDRPGPGRRRPSWRRRVPRVAALASRRGRPARSRMVEPWCLPAGGR